jgi:hypothetical protein
MLWSTFFQNLALFCVKNANFFRKMFRRKYSKTHNIGPWSHWLGRASLSSGLGPFYFGILLRFRLGGLPCFEISFGIGIWTHDFLFYRRMDRFISNVCSFIIVCRVTRLGEFSPNVRLFTSGSHFIDTAIAHIFGLLYFTVEVMH